MAKRHLKASAREILKAMLPEEVAKGAAFQKKVLDAATHIADREFEALNLYEPLPFQERFHACMAAECVLVKANRAGGSLCGCVEDARAATGQDPYNKYPKENGILAVMGYGLQHIGRVLHKYLFRPGAFRVIKDEHTKAWRVYRPWPMDQIQNGHHGDLERKDESREAPPLIPKRMIKAVAWDSRAEYIFSRVDMKNGWTIMAFNTAGDPNQAQGFNANLVHIDEDTASPGWYREMVGRCAAVGGYLRWTALPHVKNAEMMNLLDRAEDQAELEKPDSVVLRASMFDNAYLPDDARRRAIAIWKSEGEDIFRQRAYGEIVLDNKLMYPNFSTEIHDAIKEKEPRLEIQRILTERGGEPPSDWCRYLAIDPGHTVCAVLFAAVPPPSLGDHVVIYDELYLHNCTTEMFADKMREKCYDHAFQEFVIDAQGGRHADLASGIQPMFQYQNALEERGVRSIGTGSGFRHGSTNIDGRVGLLRTWLSIRADGTSKAMIVTKRCPNLVLEMRRFKKKMVNINGVTMPLDEGERRRVHAVECWEYLAAHGCPYIKPKKNVVNVSWFDTVMAQRKAREAQRAARLGGQSDRIISLGPKS